MTKIEFKDIPVNVWTKTGTKYYKFMPIVGGSGWIDDDWGEDNYLYLMQLDQGNLMGPFGTMMEGIKNVPSEMEHHLYGFAKQFDLCVLYNDYKVWNYAEKVYFIRVEREEYEIQMKTFIRGKDFRASLESNLKIMKEIMANI